MATFAGRYDEVLFKHVGNRVIPATSATVTVFESDGTTQATLYTSRTKATTAANPVSPDSAGNLEFFAAPGTYVLSIVEDSSVVATEEVTVHLDAGDESEGLVDSVNGATGAVMLDADDISDAATTNKFTDATSVAAAGAAMKSSANTFTDDQEINGGGFTNSLDTGLWVAPATRANPVAASQGIYTQHRVTDDAGAAVHDGLAGELRVTGITNATFLNGIEASAVVTGGANTIPDIRALTANINTSGTPSGTITDAAVIRAQAIGALAGTLAITTAYGLYVEAQTVGTTNYTIYAPSGTSVVGVAKVDAANFKIVGGQLLIRNGTDSGTFLSISSSGLIRWNDTGLQQTTVGAAGAASALPANPTKYLKVLDSAGTTLVIPAYAAT